MLVEAPIHAFPEGTVHLDLPQGATQCLAALKRLKPDSTSETKKTFLGRWFIMSEWTGPDKMVLGSTGYSPWIPD